VVREPLLDQRPHRLFRLLVGGGHRAQIRFVVDRNGLAKIGPDHLPGGVGETERERDKRIELDR
jgi:hypothetical protein